MAIGATRRGRLSRAVEFERVYRRGRAVSGRNLVVYLFRSGHPGEARLGLSVRRQVGGAVERNRIKRLLREAFRLSWADRLAGFDLVVVAREGAARLAAGGLGAVREELDPLVERALGGEER